MSAVISECGRWRYLLRRDLGLGAGNCDGEGEGEEDGVVNFVMLNPSTADAVHDDPTIRRCIGFARRWGYRELLVTNLFALRTPDPLVLRRAADPVGPENDRYLQEAAGAAGLVVVAWGMHGALHGRDAAVLAQLDTLVVRLGHLGVTGAGLPRHPLFVRGDVAPSPFTRG